MMYPSERRRNGSRFSPADESPSSDGEHNDNYNVEFHNDDKEKSSHNESLLQTANVHSAMRAESALTSHVEEQTQYQRNAE